jgi:HEAT repeat protein
MQTSTANVAEWIEQLPEPDQPGQASKFTGPPPEEAARLCERVLAAGPAGVDALIGLIREPGDPEFKSYKAAYLLHCVAIHVGAPGTEAHREMFATSLAAHLGSSTLSKPVQRLLIRELQVAGSREVVAALGKVLLDQALGVEAAMALAALGDGAAAQLRRSLPKATGAIRLAIAQSLGVLRDAGSVSALQGMLRDADAEARLVAAWALARIGDPRSVDALLGEADAAAGWQRIKATQACLLLAENLSAAGKRTPARIVYTHLRDTRTDPAESHVREAAAKALSGPGW